MFIIERWSSMKCFKWDQSLPYFALEKTRIIFAELNEWYCQTRTRSWSKRITKHIHSIIILCRVIQSVNTSHGRKASLFTNYLNEQVSKMHCPSQLELTTHLPASLSQDFSKFQEPNPRIKNIIFRAVFFFPGKKSNPCGVFKKHSGWQVGKVQSTRLFLSNQKNPLPVTCPTRNGVFNSLSKEAFLSAPFKMRSCTSWILPFTQAWRIFLEQRNGND